MSRGQGRVYRRFSVWWIDYTVGGHRNRESTDAATKRDAQDILRERIGDRKSGKMIGRPERVVLAEYTMGEDGKMTLSGGLRWLHEIQYDIDGLRSKDRIRQLWVHVEKFFGAGTRAIDVTETRLDEYAKARLAEGAARQTVNNELAALRRGFKLAVEKRLLSVPPSIKLPKVQNVRSGFFEDGDLAAVLLELPADARRDVVEFLTRTGWRRNEGLLLQWSSVDRDGEIIRLERARSKSGKPRVFPYGLFPALKALIDKRWTGRNGLYVFHLNGRPIGLGALRCAWRSATKRAGLPGRLIHDLRRTAARNMRRAGVSEGEIMALCGWKTRAMFDRYNIIDEADLAAAVAKFAAVNGTVVAQSRDLPGHPASLTSSSINL